jgi:hypothetical protein
MATHETITFRYTFKLTSGPVRVFKARLDAASLRLVSSRRGVLPDWTRLESHQCPNCPLNTSKHPHCPMAAELVELVDFFSEFVSYDEVAVRLETRERAYYKLTSVQQGASSLLGIYMVSSGCPVMATLRPMVRTHLPFATMPETAYRVVSMYLTAQYFRKRRGLEPDFDLRHLGAMYEQVQVVNRSFCERLRQIEQHDANANALVILDNFANYVSLALDGDLLEEMERPFEAFLSPVER